MTDTPIRPLPPEQRETSRGLKELERKYPVLFQGRGPKGHNF